MSAFLGPVHFWLYKKIQLQEGLIDAIGTSDDYILAHLHSHQLVQLEEHVPERWLDKIKHRFLGKIQARPLKARIR